MVVFPNSKINLGLDILSRREDGFHNISSVFYPLPFAEALEILPAEEFEIAFTGLDIPGDQQNNLIIRAYHLLSSDFDLPPVKIHLHKVLPMGAGLGGGSADAAYTIKLLNDIFELALSYKDMQAYAAHLGSDCPFFIFNQPVLATGTGVEFEEVNLNLAGKYLILVCPDVHVGTAEAYSRVRPAIPQISVKEIIETIPLAEWKQHLKNDFEDSVFQIYPELSLTKQSLYEAGALYASMTGSGSSIYGIFDEKPIYVDHLVAWQGELKI